jgi:hypothetical protein
VTIRYGDRVRTLTVAAGCGVRLTPGLGDA